MEYYGNVLCVTRQELVIGGGMSISNYDKMIQRGRVNVVRKAHGKGNYALIALDSLPDKYKAKIKEMYPDGNKTRVKAWVLKNYEEDQNAVAYFMNRKDLPAARIREYIVNASVLNCCIKLPVVSG